MDLTELRDIIDHSLARRSSPETDVWLLEQHPGPWWKFRTTDPDLEPTKRAILEAVWQLPHDLYLVSEEPLDLDLVPFVQAGGPPWRVNRSKSAEEFYSTEPASGLGNWQLYAADAPINGGVPNTFQMPPTELLLLMAEKDIVLVIDVFHDDTDWCIAVR